MVASFQLDEALRSLDSVKLAKVSGRLVRADLEGLIDHPEDL